MKPLALIAVFAGTLLVMQAGDRPAPPPTSPAATVAVKPAPAPAGHPGTLPAATLTAVVQQYCVVCHNDQLLTGNVSLESFDVEKASEKAETAERMIRKLRAGMMPPPGIPRPGGDTLQVLVETIEATVDAAAKAHPNLGVRRFQRLTEAEYERGIYDLLSLDVDAAQWLPPDVLLESFDNMAAAQTFSTTLLDSYLRAATDISRLAVGNPTAAPATIIHKNPREVSQHAWDRIEGTPFGTRGGMVVAHAFPADGDYIFHMETSSGTGIGSKAAMQDMDISIDGESVATVMLEHNGGKSSPVVTEPIFVRAGQHQVSAAFVDVIDGPYEDRFSPPKWSVAAAAAGQYGLTGLTHLDQLWVTGPENVKGVSETPSRAKVFVCRPNSAAQERPCAESIVTTLATTAYRRPVSKEDVAPLMELYDGSVAAEGFEIGVRTALQGILAAPEFLFRLERMPAGMTGSTYKVSDIDLASRLSFFLWATGPDKELTDIAVNGRLSNPAVLEQQVMRMLKDPKAETLATRFVHQWLRLQDVGKVWPEPDLYPDFSAQMADAMVTETEMLFEYLIREDRSLLELFNADYTFLNERLAQHYGIEGVAGDEFRKVQYPNTQRRGILGHGSISLLTSMASRTSPVLRGKWVMEVIMGTPPPPPPPNIPAFDASPDNAGGRRLTTRERMEAHAKSPVCNSCHRFIDPIGLALDNYDVVGKWRIRENMAALDTRGVFYDGTAISSPSELTAVLLKRPIPLVRNFEWNLLAYAIGRPPEYYDQPTIRAITKAAEAGNYKMSALILGIVESDLFLMRQVQTTAN